jgi:Protein of unknown function (DUF2408)
MNESGVYTEADLQPFIERISELKAIIVEDGHGESETHVDTPPAFRKLLLRKLDDCRALYVEKVASLVTLTNSYFAERMVDSLVDSLSVLSHELISIHQRLIHIRRQLAAIASGPKLNKCDIQGLQDELRKIDSYVIFPRH